MTPFACARWIALLAIVLTPPHVARAWHAEGHRRATRLAVAALPKEMPRFLTDGAATAAHSSVDPDLFTRPIGPDVLHAAEAPEHYFDLELLGSYTPPPKRYDFLRWSFGKNLPPGKVGLAPYAVTEWTYRLAVAFAEHRKWPASTHVLRKCLVYAGILCHYAADSCMPLHTTIHYDGRARPDGSSPRSGIHPKTDALPGKLPAKALPTIDPKAIQPFNDLFPAVMAQLRQSHTLVERVYELEKHLPALDKPLKAKSPAAAFAVERLKASATFTARILRTAWEDSKKIELPSWHLRPTPTGITTKRMNALRHVVQPEADSATTTAETLARRVGEVATDSPVWKPRNRE